MALDAIEQLLVANHGFTVTPEGAVVSPSGQVRNVVDGKTVFTPYTPPTTGPTFAEQFAAQQAQAIADTNQVRQDEAIASGQDTYQSVATDGSGAVTDVSVGTPANLQEQILSVGQPTFSSGSPTQALPPASTQTREELESALADAKDLDLEGAERFKNRKSDLTGVTYGDKKAFEYDLGEEYDNVVAVRSGNSVKFYKDGERVDSDVLGIDSLGGESGNDKIKSLFNQLRDQEVQEVYDQFGGQEGALVSEYLADEAAAERARQKKDERSDERDQERFDALRNQVKKEADALGISTDEYYALPPSMRIGMGLTDIGELFGETNIVPSSDYGGLLGAYNPTNVSSGLGTLSSENAAEYGKAARDYLSKNYAPNYSPSLDTMDAMYDADVGGTYTPPVSNTSDFEIFGDTGQDIYSIGGIDLGPGDPVGPGAGSNTGGGAPAGGSGGDADDDPFVDDPSVGGDTGTNIGVIDPIGGGGGPDQGGGMSPTGLRESAYGLTLDDVLVPSTVNYGTDPRFANLAPTFRVSEAAMPSFSGLPITPPKKETHLLAQGGIVSLAGGGTPMDQFTKDFFIRLIPEALNDPNTSMARRIARIHQESDLGIDDETFRSLKYYKGFSQGGVASLSDTARNMFRPMVG